MAAIDKEPFWAGGSAAGWFVKFHRHGVLDRNGWEDDITIIWFDSRDFANGERGACDEANRVAECLNHALTEVN